MWLHHFKREEEEKVIEVRKKGRMGGVEAAAPPQALLKSLFEGEIPLHYTLDMKHSYQNMHGTESML